MSIRFVFAWYDFWVGLYWDRRNRTLYFLPVPMFGLEISFPPRHVRRDSMPVRQSLSDRLDDICRKHHGATPYEDEVMGLPDVVDE